jgi:hypothetical protein
MDYGRNERRTHVVIVIKLLVPYSMGNFFKSQETTCISVGTLRVYSNRMAGQTRRDMDK